MYRIADYLVCDPVIHRYPAMGRELCSGYDLTGQVLQLVCSGLQRPAACRGLVSVLVYFVQIAYQVQVCRESFGMGRKTRTAQRNERNRHKRTTTN